MKVLSFIEPPQQDVIEMILRHCGLWEEPARAPPAAPGSTANRDAVQEALTELSRAESLDKMSVT